MLDSDSGPRALTTAPKPTADDPAYADEDFEALKAPSVAFDGDPLNGIRLGSEIQGIPGHDTLFSALRLPSSAPGTFVLAPFASLRCW
jgi:hypothetical protein